MDIVGMFNVSNIKKVMKYTIYRLYKHVQKKELAKRK